jgi:hypothetical protein
VRDGGRGWERVPAWRQGANVRLPKSKARKGLMVQPRRGFVVGQPGRSRSGGMGLHAPRSRSGGDGPGGRLASRPYTTACPYEPTLPCPAPHFQWEVEVTVEWLWIGEKRRGRRKFANLLTIAFVAITS